MSSFNGSPQKKARIDNNDNANEKLCIDTIRVLYQSSFFKTIY